MIRRFIRFCILLAFFIFSGLLAVPVERSADPCLAGAGTVFVDGRIVASGVVSA
jgi:hypothetical protein